MAGFGGDGRKCTLPGIRSMFPNTYFAGGGAGAALGYYLDYSTFGSPGIFSSLVIYY